MEIFLAVLLLAVGIALIVKGGDFFVDAASWFAEVSGIPKLIVGATVVSFATTLPELLVSAFAAFEARDAGDPGLVDMAIGNAVGSVTANLGLIFAIALVAMPTVIRRKDYLLKMILMLGAASAVVVFSLLFEGIGLVSSILLLAIFAVAMFDNIREAVITVKAEKAAKAENGEKEKATRRGVIVNIVKFVLGAAGIVFGADLLVDNASTLASLCGVSDRVISVTIVAIGTSLPELVTTITSLKKGRASLGVGNVIGANVFNLVLVSGVAVSLAPFDVPCENLLLDTGLNLSLVFDIPVMLLVMSLMIFPAFAKKKLGRWQGIALLAIYAAFCVCQFML